MSMITFNFDQFLLDKRLTIPELAEKIKYGYTTVYLMMQRGSVKLSFVRDLEKEFGDCSGYMITTKQPAAKNSLVKTAS